MDITRGHKYSVGWYQLIILVVLPLCLASAWAGEHEKLVREKPEDFVDVSHYIPEIMLDIRYYSNYNFVGDPIDGYKTPKCFLSRRAAKALKGAQEAAQEQGLVLKVLIVIAHSRQ